MLTLLLVVGESCCMNTTGFPKSLYGRVVWKHKMNTEMQIIDINVFFVSWVFELW